MTGDSVPLPAAHDRPREDEDWFRRATTAGRVGVWDWDILTDAVTWSDVIYDIHGLEKGTFGGTAAHFAELVHEDDRPHVNEAIQRAIHDDLPYDVEFRAVRPDGGIVWISSHAEVKRDEAGKAVRIYGATVDVTARRHTEDALRRSEQRFRVMANAAPVLIWLSGPDGGRTWCIEPDRLPHIFEMFSRASDPREEPRLGGLGIGLALVKSLVEMHGGSIEARSEGRGMGSEFIVRLPIDDAEVTPRAQQRPGEATNGAAEATNGTSPRRVLVVDDNRDAANALSVLLTQHGHEVQTAFDGPEAVEAATSWEPEVIILDLGLPSFDGLEAARRIRAQQSRRKVLLVALTGWSQDEDRRKTARAGFDAHLVKPVNIEQLVSLLAAYGED